MRLIEVDALFKAFEKAAWYNNADRDEIAEEILEQMPTIEADSVRHGRWEWFEEWSPSTPKVHKNALIVDGDAADARSSWMIWLVGTETIRMMNQS